MEDRGRLANLAAATRLQADKGVAATVAVAMDVTIGDTSPVVGTESSIGC